jgi:hypothetical protein
MLIVTNGLEQTIAAKFAGQDFEFPPGKDVPCDEEAAAHIFGFGEPDKSIALLRLGWITPGHDKVIAEERLKKIVFKRATVTIAPAKE